jgi:hypothetical protein
MGFCRGGRQLTVVLLSQDVAMEIKSGPGCDWDANSHQDSLTITCQ